MSPPLLTPQFGWVGPIRRAHDVAQAGLDYLELQVMPMGLEYPGAYSLARLQVRELPLPVRALNYLFPHDFRLMGDNVNENQIRQYFDKVVDIALLSNAKTLVFGSGWVREISTGSDLSKSKHQFLTALEWFSKALSGSELAIVIEPLNKNECNFINTVAQAAELVRTLNHPQVRCHVDLFHLNEQGENHSTVGEHADLLKHVHVSDTDRFQPGTGRYDIASFFKQLKYSDYQGAISADCSIKGDPVQAMRDSLAYLKKTWAAA